MVDLPSAWAGVRTTAWQQSLQQSHLRILNPTHRAIRRDLQAARMSTDQAT